MLSFYIVRPDGLVRDPVAKRPGFLFDRMRKNKAETLPEKEVVMKFLIIMLAVHFVNELISNKRENKKTNADKNEIIRHPAEFSIR